MVITYCLSKQIACLMSLNSLESNIFLYRYQKTILTIFINIQIKSLTPKQMNSLFISVFSPSAGDSVAMSMVKIRKLNKNHLFKALLKNNCLVTMAMCNNLVTRCMNVWIPFIIPGMQVPERMLALWKPFLRLFQRMNLLPPLLQSLVSKISEHGSQLDRLLMCWTISIANALCNTGNDYFSKQQDTLMFSTYTYIFIL